jgi:hypothetical protein
MNESDYQREHRLRPGISNKFLEQQQVRRIGAEEAFRLVGYRESGLYFPYFNFSSGQQIVDSATVKPFGRLRVDNPRAGGAKYLSPKGSEVHLYVPTTPPFSADHGLWLREGEAKALAMCESGLRSVAIGGISCAMSHGKLLRELVVLLEKFCVRTLYFLGDADTCFLFDFAREASKLATELHARNIALALPRIPFGHPNGIDVREQLGDAAFPDFVREIRASAEIAHEKSDASTRAGSRRRVVGERPRESGGSFDHARVTP